MEGCGKAVAEEGFELSFHLRLGYNAKTAPIANRGCFRNLILNVACHLHHSARGHIVK